VPPIAAPVIRLGSDAASGVRLTRTIEIIDYFGFVLPKFGRYNYKFTNQLLQSTRPRRRASSISRIANLRRERARRSYRSIARNCFAFCDKIVASSCGPSGVEATKFTWPSIGRSGAFGRSRLFKTRTFSRMFAPESE
jgi:hypothetical protein